MRRVWGRVNSINVMKVLWCLDELGLHYERIDAGLEHGVVDEPRYRALNPNGRVPTLEEDGFVLWESNAIVRYLCAASDLGGMCPRDERERALAEQWMDWQQTTPHADLTYVFWRLVRNRPPGWDPEDVAAAARRLGEQWAIVDRHLEGREYLLGDRLTMADIPLGCAMWRWTNLAIERPALPRLEAWHERLKARPAFRSRVMLPLT